MEKANKKIDFIVHLRTEFGLGMDKRMCKSEEGIEETFLSALKSLPKNQAKRWISIEFDFLGKIVTVDRGLLTETCFDFWESVEITDL